ncbi:unnamed protein product [Onchocerca flexuosa]|uniref:Zinc finger, C2H2 type n=1 Tax=Onchocerca flexuosa TaxID=387005 RepID=A0A183H039_9BILA|nr:unnamed protein product [Onchocerca flexuosa]
MNIAAFEQSASGCMEIRMTEDELRKTASIAFCEICSRTFANKNAFHLHQVKTHSRICGEGDLALFHRKRVASGTEKHYFCPVIDCRYNSGRSFKTYKLLHQHFLKVHNEKRFRCDKCKTAKFSLQRDLLYHQRKRCLIKGVIRMSSLAGIKSDCPEVKRHSEKLFTRNRDQNIVSTASENKFKNVIFINVNVVQANCTPSFRQIYPKPNSSFRMTKSSQTDYVKCYDRSTMCHAGSQTTHCSTCERSASVLHKYNDFHCQTHIASGVEFGTQIYPEEIASRDLHIKHTKTHNDFEFEDIWRHIETQTSTFTGNDALTQTAIDFMDSASMTDWDLLI